LFSAFALLTICLVAAQPVSLLASQRHTDSSKTPTTTKLKLSPTTIKEGQKVEVTVTVTPSKATGDVYLYIKPPSGSYEKVSGHGVLHDGTVSTSGSIDEPGKFEFKVVYGGSSTYASSTSNVVTLTVEKK
jgi:hypothetical protein